MPLRARTLVAALVICLTLPGIVAAQDPLPMDPLLPPNPIRPLTKEDLDHRESLHLYVLGVLRQREDRLLDAVEAFEKAAKLDPKATPIYKALISLNIVLDRGSEVFAYTKKVLELAPNDAPTWVLLGRQLRLQGKSKEAIDALERSTKCPKFKGDQILGQRVYGELGVLYESQKQPIKAAKAFGACAALLDHPEAILETGLVHPEEITVRCAEAYERMGRNWFQARRFDEAMTAFRKAQAKYPAGASRISLDLALVCKEKKELPEAVGHLDKHLQSMPAGSEAYEMKIGLLRQLKREREVLPWLEEASAKDHFNVSLKMLLAVELGKGQQFAKAEEIVRQQAAITPTGTVYRSLFALYEQDPKAGTARLLQVLDQTLVQALNDGDPAAATAKGQARAMVAALNEDMGLTEKAIQAGIAALDRNTALSSPTLQLLGALAGQQQQAAASERLYRAALKDLPAEQIPVVYGALLQNLWKQRKYADIAELCKKGLDKAAPAHRVVFNSNLARALACLGQPDAALEEVDKALALVGNGDKLSLRLLRVRMLAQAERGEEAVKQCGALLKDSPLPADQMEVHYLLSTVYTQQKELAKAEQELEECLKIDPNNITVNNDLGYLWADQHKRLEKAEAMIRKAMDLDKKQRTTKAPFGVDAGPEPQFEENAAFVDSLGWVLYRRGKLKEARVELERACKLPEGDDPLLWDHLGDVRQALDLHELAVEAWERALHLCDQEKRRKMDDKKQDLERKIKQQTKIMQ